MWNNLKRDKYLKYIFIFSKNVSRIICRTTNRRATNDPTFIFVDDLFNFRSTIFDRSRMKSIAKRHLQIIIIFHDLIGKKIAIKTTNQFKISQIGLAIMHFGIDYVCVAI